MKKALIIINSSQNIYNFRLPLINKLETNGYSVETVSLDDKYDELLKSIGIRNHCIISDNRSINPLKALRLKRKLYRLICNLKPDVVFTFMIKPNVFGTLAAKKAKVENIYSMVEGAGEAFIDRKGLKAKIVKKAASYLCKKAFKYPKKVFFLNDDDANEFINLGIVNKEKALVINGVGVDLEKFAFSKLDNTSSSFVMASRMLIEKGVLDYCKCAEIVKKTHPEAKFYYLGADGNITKADIQKYIDNGSIEYLGNVKDVRPYIASSLMLILPSYYREGRPMSIMEAQSIGRPVITCNSIGCKDMVIDGYNGYLIEAKDYQTLASKCCYILDNKEVAVKMGINARKFAEENYDQNVINDYILKTIDN